MKRRITKSLQTYADHLKMTFRDGFPSGTSYQKRESKGVDVKILRGPELTEVFMIVPEWTKDGPHTKTFLHSLVVEKPMGGHRKGDILKPGRARPGGSLRNYGGISWNRV